MFAGFSHNGNGGPSRGIATCVCGGDLVLVLVLNNRESQTRILWVWIGELASIFYVIRPWGYTSVFSFCPGLPHIEECCFEQGNHTLKLHWILNSWRLPSQAVFKVSKLPQFFLVLVGFFFFADRELFECVFLLSFYENTSRRSVKILRYFTVGSQNLAIRNLKLGFLSFEPEPWAYFLCYWCTMVGRCPSLLHREGTYPSLIW